MTNPKCIICRNEVSGGSDAAYEILCWESSTGLSDKDFTGRTAHITCLHGEPYDRRQMTISDLLETR